MGTSKKIITKQIKKIMADEWIRGRFVEDGLRTGMTGKI